MESKQHTNLLNPEYQQMLTEVMIIPSTHLKLFESIGQGMTLTVALIAIVTSEFGVISQVNLELSIEGG